MSDCAARGKRQRSGLVRGNESPLEVPGFRWHAGSHRPETRRWEVRDWGFRGLPDMMSSLERALEGTQRTTVVCMCFTDVLAVENVRVSA